MNDKKPVTLAHAEPAASALSVAATMEGKGNIRDRRQQKKLFCIKEKFPPVLEHVVHLFAASVVWLRHLFFCYETFCENENFLQVGAVTSMPSRSDVTWFKKNNLHTLHVFVASLTQAFALAVALLW